MNINGKHTNRWRFLAWLLTAAMVSSSSSVTAFAENYENAELLLAEETWESDSEAADTEFDEFDVSDEETQDDVTDNLGEEDAETDADFEDGFDAETDAEFGDDGDWISEAELLLDGEEPTETTFESFFTALNGYATVTNDSAYPYQAAMDGENSCLSSTNKSVSSKDASISLVAQSPIILTFSYRISSEPRYDYMKVVLNGTDVTAKNKADYSGLQTEYSTYSINLNAGDQLRIGYYKDSGGDKGEDTLYLRDFNAELMYTISFPNMPEGSTITLKNEDDESIAVAGKSAAVSNGTYSWTAECFGYVSKSGTITVENADVTVGDVLEAASGHSVKFNVTGEMDGYPYTIAILHDNAAVDAELDQENSVTLLPASYTYTITGEGYKKIAGSFTIEEEALVIDCTLEPVAVLSEYLADLLAVSEMTNDAEYPWVVDEDGTKIYSTNQKKSNSKSEISFTFTRPAIVSFVYEVSSEKNYDKLIIEKEAAGVISTVAGPFSDNNGISGNVTANFLAGETLKLRYQKDSGGDKGTDTASVSGIQVTDLYQITFENAPQGAVITLKDTEDQNVEIVNGVASVRAGSYTYTSEAFGYAVVQGTVDVSEDTTVDLTAQALEGKKVTFVIGGLAEGVIPQITVKHGDVSFEADEEGAYSLVPAEYTYRVKAEGYKTARGSFTVEEEDLEIPVDMDEGNEWEGEVAEEYAGGTGTADDPYQIANGDQLAFLSAQVDAGTTYAGQYFVLTKDVLMGNEAAFTPIGSSKTKAFQGTFDGQGYTISGLKVNGASNSGLFGYTINAVIRNLTVNGTISGESYVGGIVGYGSTTTIENCANYASVSGRGTNIGGIAGWFEKGTIQRCYNKGSISGGGSNYSYLAGIVGNLRDQAVLQECYNTGSVNITGKAGGIAGIVYSATVKQAYNVGSVAGTGDACSIIGYCGSNVTADSCYYLSGTKATSDGKGTNMHEESAEEMAMASTVAGLGGSFVTDDLNQNNGYPVLAWQDPNAQLTVVISVNYEAEIEVTDENGTVVAPQEDGSYKLSNGTYSYRVSREECNTEEGTFTVAGSGLLINVELTVMTYPLSLSVNPEDAAIVITNADNEVVEAAEDGYKLAKGEYSWKASKFGYVAQSGSLTITGEEDSLSITLEEAPRYNVSITTTDKDTQEPVEAAIELRHATGGVQNVQEDGTYQLPAETYSYIATAEGYVTAKGNIEVSEDTTEFEILMEQGSDVWTGEIAETEPQKETIDGKEFYLITSGEELAWFRKAVADGQTAINGKAMTNLLLNDTDSTVNDWEGIGDYSKKYTGTFDGNGKTISGYYSTKSGLFGYVGEGAEIKNITISGTINASSVIGGIANQSYGSIKNCTNRMNIVNTSGPTGGIAGRIYASAGTIENCANEGNISGNLKSSYSDNYVGGIAGQSYASIDQCSNTGDIYAAKGYVYEGGILGGPATNSTVALTNCYNQGSVTASAQASTPYVGGIVGRHTLGTPTINNCYNSGMVSSSASGAKVGAIAADINGNVMNCYYLEGSAPAAIGMERSGFTVEAAQKTSEEMTGRAFVLELSNQAFGLVQGNYPVLLWQGGEIVEDSEAAAEVAAAKEALEMTETLVTESKQLELPTLEDFAGSITWSSSNTDIISDDGLVTLPQSGTEYVTLTATITKDGASAQKNFIITVKSLDEQENEALEDARIWLENYGSLKPQYIEGENLNEYVQSLLVGRAQEDASKSMQTQITVSVLEQGNMIYPVYEADGEIAENGDITWFYADPATLQYSANQATISDVKLSLSLGDKTAEVTKNVSLAWDHERLMSYLQAAAENAEQVFDSYKDEDGNIVIPVGAGTIALPKTQEGYRFTKAEWHTMDPNLNITDENPLSDTVTMNVLTPETQKEAKLSFYVEFLCTDDSDPIYFDAEDVTLTLMAESLDDLRAEMQQQLDDNYTIEKLKGFITKKDLDPQNIDEDIQLPTPKNTGIENYSNYKFTAASSDESVVKISGYHADVYRPMPNEQEKDVTITVTMSHRTKDVSVSKAFDLKVLPLEESELQEAVALMNQVKDAYWDGINDGANASPLKVTASLHAFQEAHLDTDGNLVWAYNYNDKTGIGIIPGDQRDYKVLEQQEEYNKFKSSNKAVIAHENLVLTQPQYHTAVTISSVLEHTIYAKYAKTVTEGTWYEQYFSKLYNVPVSADLTVIGTDGEDPEGEDHPVTAVTVRVRMNGVNRVGAVDKTIETTSDKTIAEAITEALGSEYTLNVVNGYISSLTGSDAFNQENSEVAYWGQYLRYGDTFDTNSPLTNKVTDGAVYGIMPYTSTTVEPNMWGSSIPVWFDETSYTAQAGESIKLTLYQMSADMSGALKMPGIPVTLNGEPIGTTDNNGQIEVAKEVNGTYTFEVTAENYSYTYADVIVTGGTDPEPTPTPTPETAKNPVLVSATCAATGVLVKWKASEGATRYRVYRKTANGKWGRIGETEQTSFTDKAAVSGTKYFYTVRCLGSDGSLISGYDKNGKSVQYVAAPEITKVENRTKAILVQWKAVKGAKKYRVFRKVDNSDWKRIKDTENLNVTDENVEAGKVYTYTVRCIDAAGKSYISAYDKTGKSTTYLDACDVTLLLNRNEGIKIEWTSVKGAEGYEVYRANADGGKYSIIATVEGNTTTYTDTSALTNGVQYKYAVRAYQGSAKGYFVSSKVISRLTTPALGNVVNNAAGSMKVSWNRNAKATGYQVWYKTGSTVKKVTVKGNNTLSKVITSLKKGSSYDVHVRSYITVGNTNYYSAWSGKKTVTIKK